MELIKLENVSKKFGDKIIFSNINLSVNSGEMIAITGESGKGKTTLLNILGLISQNTDGIITVFGNKNIRINSKKAMMLRREKIGYLFQNYGLIDDETVNWNLNLALEYKNIKKTEKTKFINRVLQELSLIEYANKEIYKLSGGEQQRVALARLILQDSELILADEPTGSLDNDNREIVLKILKKLNNNGKTIIIVTHDKYVANSCKKNINLQSLIKKCEY